MDEETMAECCEFKLDDPLDLLKKFIHNSKAIDASPASRLEETKKIPSSCVNTDNTQQQVKNQLQPKTKRKSTWERYLPKVQTAEANASSGTDDDNSYSEYAHATDDESWSEEE